MANHMSTNEQGVPQKAGDLAGSAKAHTEGVAQDVRQEASAVVSEAGAQARNLADEAKAKLRTQADDSTGRAAGALGDLGTRLRALAEGDVERAGDLTRYAGDVGDRLGSAADRLGERGLDGIVQDVQRFARQRPGLFLAAAATTGFAAGRLFRGAKADAESSADDYAPSAAYTTPSALSEGAVPSQSLPPSSPPQTWSTAGTAAPPVAPQPPVDPVPPVPPSYEGVTTPVPPYGTSAGEHGGQR